MSLRSFVLASGLLLSAAVISETRADVSAALPSLQTVKGIVSPTVTSSNGTINVTVDVRANEAQSDTNVALSLITSKGTQIVQKTFSKQSFTAGQTRSYSWSVTLAADTQPGDYFVKAGVFTANWSARLLWETVAQYTVSSAVPFQAIKSTVSPSVASANGTIDITADIRANEAYGDMNIALSLVTSKGSQIVQKTFSKQGFTAGQVRSYSWSVKLAADTPAGNYAVKVGAFNSNWSTRLLWDTLAQYSVQAGSPHEYLGAFPVQGAKFKIGVPIKVMALIRENQETVTVCYRVDGGTCTSIAPNQAVILNSLSAGAHQITYQISAPSGSQTVTKNFTVASSFPSNQAPNIELLFPKDGAVNVLNDRPLMAIASDPEGLLHRVRFVLSGSEIAIAVTPTVAGTPDLTLSLPANRFPPIGSVEIGVSTNDTGYVTTNAAQTLDFADPTFQPPSSLSTFEAFSIQKWNLAFAKNLKYEKFHKYDPSWTGEEFAWDAGYWLRAYLKMAELTSSRFYLNKAKTIVDIFFMGTDKEKHKRGELNLIAKPYQEAPDYYMMNPGTPTNGWFRALTGSPAVTPLIDGHIASAIMAYVDLVLTDSRFSDQANYARENYLPKVATILSDHDTSWVDNRYPLIPGSFYFTRLFAPGIYSKPVGYNHNATFFTAGLLVNKHLPNPTFKTRAEKTVQYFKNYVRTSGGAYIWDYDPGTAAPKLEDIGHAHMDIRFLRLAHQLGVGGMSSADFVAMANTFRTKVYIGGGKAFDLLNGSGTPNPANLQAVGYDWLDLVEFDRAILPPILDIYQVNNPMTTINPSSRAYLGWASILFWKSKGY